MPTYSRSSNRELDYLVIYTGVNKIGVTSGSYARYEGLSARPVCPKE